QTGGRADASPRGPYVVAGQRHVSKLVAAGRPTSGDQSASRYGAPDLGPEGELFLVGEAGRCHLADHVRGGVAEHLLGADVEDLDDAGRVGGGGREVGAVEDRGVQRGRRDGLL